jgi:hypothetical protein
MNPMKMGEIRVQPDGTFVMNAPDGIQPVTLRCKVNGVVAVEEVADGPMSTRAMKIKVGMKIDNRAISHDLARVTEALGQTGIDRRIR